MFPEKKKGKKKGGGGVSYKHILIIGLMSCPHSRDETQRLLLGLHLQHLVASLIDFFIFILIHQDPRKYRTSDVLALQLAKSKSHEQMRLFLGVF